ncbi:MAG: VWA domain-containing protein [Phycisphaerales bacterium]|nr:VWA domain-containing protein [Phycisphaerales bacterium]
MNFLAPWYLPALATVLTVPPLVLLYFLKLKRQELPISSTLLWKRAVEDLQVNAPFQRLKSNLLLFLQLLLLLLAILAIAEPTWSGPRDWKKSVVLILDQSASMAVEEGARQTRLDLAKEQARQAINDLASNQKAMVIGFSNRARVLQTFTNDKNALHRAVERIEQTDAVGRLTEAMNLAEVYAMPTGEEAATETEVSDAQYIVFTDGRLPDTADITVQRGTMDIVRIGNRRDNVGIVNLDVRRNYEKPELLSVLVRVRNFGYDPASRDISLLVDDQLRSVQAIPLLAPLADRELLTRMPLSGLPPEGNEVSIAFELPLATAARIEVRLSGTDALPIDDRAYAIVPPPRAMNILLVTPGNYYLRRLVPAMPVANCTICSPEEYEEASDDKLIENGRCLYDVVIIDGHSTERLPAGNYLFFAGAPLIEGVRIGPGIEGQPFLDWDETHPVLRHVSVPAINVFSWLDIKLPNQAIPLIEGPEGPVLAVLRQERNQYLICAFGLFDSTRTYLNTDWVLNEGFVVFVYNALRYLAGATSAGQIEPVRPGEPFTVAARPEAASVRILRPDGEYDQATASPTGLATYGRTNKVGIYSIATGIAGEDARAVNLLDEQESFIAPNKDFHIATGSVTATGSLDRSRRPLWPYLLMTFGLVLLLEWIIYNKRVFV